MKCLFDNQLPPKLAKTLSFLEGEDGIIVVHLKERFSPDVEDVEWINKLAKEGGWFVITKDNQIRKRTHERRAWQESHIPIVFLQKTWINLNLWEMAWRLIKCWPNLKETIKQDRGRKSFQLSVNGNITAIE